MGSRLVLEVLAGLSFAHQDCLHQRVMSARTRKHIGEAVRLLNEKLRRGEVEDSVILAVGTMFITSATLAADKVRI